MTDHRQELRASRHRTRTHLASAQSCLADEHTLGRAAVQEYLDHNEKGARHSGVYSGMSLQPMLLTDFTQEAVRLGWLQPRFLPPT